MRKPVTHRIAAITRLVLASALVSALAIPPVSASAVTDDDIPGVSLFGQSSPVAGTLNETTDIFDVYSLPIMAGQSLTVTLTADPGVDFDLFLYGPDAVSVTGSDEPRAVSAGNTSDTESFTYTATTSGTFFVACEAYAGSGSYTLSWQYAAGTIEADANFPGVPLASSVVTGTLDHLSDTADVYWVDVAKGEKITATLDADELAGDFGVYLWDRTLTDIETSNPLDYALGPAYPVTVSYIAPETGRFYVAARSYTGGGAYTLTVERSPGRPVDGNDEIPGQALPSADVTGTLDTRYDSDDIYAVSLLYAQQLTITLSSDASAPADFDLKLYSPGAASLADGDHLIAAAETVGTSETITYPAATAGTYYIDVHAAAGVGAYRLQAVKTQMATEISAIGDSVVNYGATGLITGVLKRTAGNIPLVGYPVTIESRIPGTVTWKAVTQVMSGANGVYSAKVKPTRKMEYRARFAGDRDHRSGSSNVLTMIPRAYLTAPYPGSSVTHGKTFTAYGFLKPRHTQGKQDVVIRFYRYEPKGDGTFAWVYRKGALATNVNYSTYTKYVRTMSLPYAGTWKAVATITGDALHATTTSAERQFTVK